MLITDSIRQVLRNIAWLMSSKFLSYLSTGIASIVVARVLGPESIGLIAWAMSVVVFVDTIAFMGMDPILFKHFTRRPRGKLDLLTTALKLRFILAAIAYAIMGLYVFYSYRQGKYDHLLLLISALQLFTHYGYLVTYWFHSRVEANKVVRWEIPASFFSAALRIYVVISGFDIYAVVIILVLSQLMESLGITWSLLHDYQFRQQTKSAMKIKSLRNPGKWVHIRFMRNTRILIYNGWPFLFVSLSHFIYMRIDQVMLPVLYSRKETGFYTSASMLAEMPYQISILITHSVLPGLIKLQQINSELYRTRITQFFSLMIWSSLIISTTLWFASSWLITIIYGQKFAPSSGMFQILIMGLPFMFCSCMIGPWVLANNRQYQFSLMMAFAALLNIILNWCLIPQWGGIGAGIASIFSYLITGLGCPIIYKSFKPVQTYIIDGFLLPFNIVGKLLNRNY
ncbi:MAG TPA: hypothetical protein DCM28_15270 [Phycisphaerales bacterium]|nr:hypothetical protein [Phycisphaerales bacterium]HCD35299.1 hypothetical protein [Phycisphaerales bacterium]